MEEAVIFDEIDLTDLSFAECSIKNVNHSFQVITPFRRLVLCAESRRDMEEWIAALKAANNREYYEPGEHPDFLSGHHHWYATSHARPTYCNVCREALSGVTSHGLSCEVCKFKVHKRCAAKAINNCKWTTLASVGKDIIENEDGNILMPHQWMEGNLPVSAKCAVCDKTCGSVLRLQDWRCLWCRATVHTACRPNHPVRCPLGPCKVSVVPPTALHSIGSDEAWEAVRPQGCSPLLVFVNSKSGDNLGVKFLRRLKQLLNPAQVFDLISTGPGLGLRLFRHFDPFRILVCSGDGSVGWVLSEIDRLNMHKQCQLGVLPLGTGNDLARVLGWGSSCDDDTHLPQLLEKYEMASTKMLDRWSIMTYEKSITITARKLSQIDPAFSMAAYEDSVVTHLTKILQSDDHSELILSAKILCETIKDFITRAAEISFGQGDQEFSSKCQTLKDKLDLLLQTLHEEENGTKYEEEEEEEEEQILPEGEEKSSLEKPEKEVGNVKEKSHRDSEFVPREALMSRANSLKKAIRQLVEHTENMVDDQNKAASVQEMKNGNRLDIPGINRSTDTLKVLPTIESGSSAEASPCPSPSTFLQPTDINFSSRLTALSPLPDIRRDSACEEIITLPVPVEFADPRRSLVPSEDGDAEDRQKDDAYSCIQMAPKLLVSADTAEVKDENETDKPESEKVDIDVTSEYTCTLPSKEEKELGNILIASISAERLFELNDDAIITDGRGRQGSTTESLELRQNFSELEGEASVLSQFDDFGWTESRGPITSALSSPNDNVESDTMRIGIESLESSRNEDDENIILTRRHTEPIINTLLPPDMAPSVDNMYRRVSTCLEEIEKDIGHIDSPESAELDNTRDDTSEETEVLKHDYMYPDKPSEELKNNLETELAAAGFVPQKPDIIFSSPEDEEEEKQDEEDVEVEELIKVRGCSLAHFSEDNDIARKSFYKHIRPSPRKSKNMKSSEKKEVTLDQDSDFLDVVKIQIQGSNSNLNSDGGQSPGGRSTPSNRPSIDDELLRYHIHTSKGHLVKSESEEGPRIQHDDFPAVISVVVNPPSPVMSDEGTDIDGVQLRRFSDDSTSKLSAISGASGLDIGMECSPAASRRISSGSLLKTPDSVIASAQQARDRSRSLDKDQEDVPIRTKKLPIINPLVRLPMWPNVSGGAGGLVSKVLLANADALCAAASPLMDPDETLLEGFFERAVMNNYFGIGIDAKISLDFHQKREEHPEKCRSRAKNYMWYGVLGSKEWLQKTYKNLEQRVQLECDGQRIPLPSLQGIVILNIPSFMGGTNFWGGTKEDDCFLAPSFDDRVLEVVAVFGSMQMAASRLINLQHHRIAQCQTVQINILGDEGVPIQVDGEAWIQPPGMIRIIHKNRMQMLCRNRALENSLKSWEEKQKQHLQHSLSHSLSTQSSQSGQDSGKLLPFSEDEILLLLNFIECATTLVKYVKLLTISHPSIQAELYQLAVQTSVQMEKVHPEGKIIEGPNLRPQVTELVACARQLYEEAYTLLRGKSHSLKLREDLEGKLGAALGNMELELRKCVSYDNAGLVHFQDPVLEDQGERKGRSRGIFRLKFRNRGGGGSRGARDVATWGTTEVATWLETLGLAEYVESFTRNDIRGRELLTLGRRDLKELGVTKVGHIKRILQAVRDLTM